MVAELGISHFHLSPAPLHVISALPRSSTVMSDARGRCQHRVVDDVPTRWTRLIEYHCSRCVMITNLTARTWNRPSSSCTKSALGKRAKVLREEPRRSVRPPFEDEASNIPNHQPYDRKANDTNETTAHQAVPQSTSKPRCLHVSSQLTRHRGMSSPSHEVDRRANNTTRPTSVLGSEVAAAACIYAIL